MADVGAPERLPWRLLVAVLCLVCLAPGAWWRSPDRQRRNARTGYLGPLRNALERLLAYAQWRKWFLTTGGYSCRGTAGSAWRAGPSPAAHSLESTEARFSGTAPREARPLSHNGGRPPANPPPPAGHLFVGMTPRKRFRLALEARLPLSAQRSTHRHVIGKTGSGKTSSVLWPSVLQDALDGKGVLFISGKGSDEESAR